MIEDVFTSYAYVYFNTLVLFQQGYTPDYEKMDKSVLDSSTQKQCYRNIILSIKVIKASNIPLVLLTGGDGDNGDGDGDGDDDDGGGGEVGEE